jgi:hypothetical protein
MSSANGRAKRSVKSHYGTYGIGVEYAYTMVHEAPPTVFPEYLVPSAANPR